MGVERSDKLDRFLQNSRTIRFDIDVKNLNPVSDRALKMEEKLQSIKLTSDRRIPGSNPIKRVTGVVKKKIGSRNFLLSMNNEVITISKHNGK